MNKKMQCPVCGGLVEKKNIKGKTFQWKWFSEVPVLSNYYLPVCSKCGEMFINPEAARSLDIFLKDSVLSATKEFLRKLKENSKLSQKELADDIGISEVYLSSLIGGKKVPSLSVFNLIKITAKNTALLDEMKTLKGRSSNYASKNSEMKKFKFLSTSEQETYSKESTFNNILCEEIIH
ncbi:type II toxin-antitoxin system MqsA family antitoxin [Bdellovibrio sp. BCCA]|uniref:type II toxin-antitoxin system MqsA family antitoxin n=1 Tax=Bdellovibrio sp. BCCA TaxID=3136281 RepID=UPI0030F1AEDA